jgi:aminoglycoside phosphotransferase (APT) family kinase protein
MLTAAGPLVIDWTNAAKGPPGADLAIMWLLTAAAEAPGSAWERAAVASFRRVFLRMFLARVDRDAAVAALPAVLARRRLDPNMSATELAAMAEIVAGTRS